jgi:hypothetical protein
MKQLTFRYFNVVILSTALMVGVSGVGIAQEREHQSQQEKRYEDKAHNDFHEWNDREDRAYRQYLNEHHRKYHDFAKANRKEQEGYWNWRHSHPDAEKH